LAGTQQFLLQKTLGSLMARAATPPDQAVAVEHFVDGALGQHPDVTVEPPHQQLADLARALVRFLALSRTIGVSIWAGSWLA
jgi:hypothetical protein